MDNTNDRGSNIPKIPKALLIWGLVACAVLLIYALQDNKLLRGGTEQVDYTTLMDRIARGEVMRLKVTRETGQVNGEYVESGRSGNDASRFISVAPKDSAELEKLCKDKGVPLEIQLPSFLDNMLETMLPIIILVVIMYFLIFRQMRGAGGGGILSFGKSKAQRVIRDKSQKSFDDVAGVDEAREELKEIIEFLRSPERFQRLGGRLPRGVLLIGPPGTGKTLLAKAIAGEADVPFFSISGSDFVEMFVGVGASRVRDLFEQAKQNSPCIIFVDEIDAVGRKRANDLPGSGMETGQTLNAMLVEMDGFTSNDNVIVIAATNRPDVLDPALLRPGRFDRRIYVDLPDIRGREEILKVHAKNVKLAEDVDMSVIARGTPMFSGADLENVVNEAALIAVMHNKNAVDMECFEESRDKVRFGKEKRSRAMDEDDRRSTAYHEAGHALVMLEQPHVTPLHKVTIIPRGRALGATMRLPEKDEYCIGRKKILGEIAVGLAGRAAEEIFLEDVTSGAANDFQQATGLARSMVCQWGMSEKLGFVNYPDADGSRSIFDQREYSDATAEIIDMEVRRIVDECYTTAKEILERRSEDVELLVDALMEFEVLGREEVALLFKDRDHIALREQRALRNSRNRMAEDDADSSEEGKPNEAGEPSEETNDADAQTVNKTGSDAETAAAPAVKAPDANEEAERKDESSEG